MINVVVLRPRYNYNLGRVINYSLVRTTFTFIFDQFKYHGFVY